MLHSPFLPVQKWHPGGRGRPPVDRRRVINGIFYLQKTGGQWRMRPPDFGHWSTVYGYFKQWRGDGTWADLMTQWRQMERQRQGRPPEPSAGHLDSPSIKTATPHKDISYDGHKKVKGRQRPLLVDTLALLIAVGVTAANGDERQGLRALMSGYFAAGVKRLRKLWVEGGYRAGGLQEWGLGSVVCNRLRKGTGTTGPVGGTLRGPPPPRRGPVHRGRPQRASPTE